jgi:predicted hydrocarbon binding protein
MTKKELPIKIFSTGDKRTGLNIVKSPVKLLILSLLNESEMGFDEIVKILNRSKSTISIHLKTLTEEGVISYKKNPDDKRKRIFFINSKFLGEMDNPELVEFPEQKIDYLINNLVEDKDNFKFARLMFHTLRSSLIQEGVSINPLLYESGLKIGLSIYNIVKDDDYNIFVSNIIDFWRENGLGNMNVYSEGESIKIKTIDCFECEFLPKKGKPACFLDLGILTALFSTFLNKDINIIEIKCYSMGDDCCLFEVEDANEGIEEINESS